MSDATSWNAIFFFMHFFGFLGACLLYRNAPCWMQRLTVVGVAIGMFVLMVANAIALAGGWWSWWVASLGFAFEHLAVLLWLFRVHFQAKPAWTLSRSL
jgi:hypothetical protein